MIESNSCPCCGNSLLKHVRSNGSYWFCPTCREEIPLAATCESQYISYEPTKNFMHHPLTQSISRLQKLWQQVKA